ncbi:MAG: hypothetical protein ACLFUV_01565 [Methanomassiliicoccales archaeon]
MKRRALVLALAVLIVAGFSGCLDGDDGGDGGDGGYNITSPVSELIVGESDFPEWHSWEGEGYATPVDDYEDFAVDHFIDAENRSEANNSMVVLLMEFDGFEDANGTYDRILAEHEMDDPQPIELGSEGSYFESNDGESIQIFFKKYRYVTAVYYNNLAGDPISIQELKELVEIQQDKIHFE